MSQEKSSQGSGSAPDLFKGRSFAQPLWLRRDAQPQRVPRVVVDCDYLRSLHLVDLGFSNHILKLHLWPDNHRAIGQLHLGSGYREVAHAADTVQGLFLAAPALLGACADALALMEELDATVEEALPEDSRWGVVKAALTHAVKKAVASDPGDTPATDR